MYLNIHETHIIFMLLMEEILHHLGCTKKSFLKHEGDSPAVSLDLSTISAQIRHYNQFIVDTTVVTRLIYETI